MINNLRRKNIIYLLFFIVLITLCAFLCLTLSGDYYAKAEIVDENGFQYSVDSSNNTYTITGYTGTYTKVTIPDTYKGLDVTAIADEAFIYNDNITEVIIGKNVITIGQYAFYECNQLKDVTFGDGKGSGSLTTIGEAAFGGCGNLGYDDYYNHETTKFPDSLTTIGKNAFEDCVYLEVEFGSDSKLTTISYGAFQGCLYMEEVIIPDSVTEIGQYAFYNCVSLEGVTIGSGVTSIGASAFRGCTALTSVTFKNTECWYATTTSGSASGTNLYYQDLSNSSTAATYIPHLSNHLLLCGRRRHHYRKRPLLVL